MWLGRTYAVSESSYPTDGDTFQVKLLSAHYTASEGMQAVTENDRGTIVTARTWPATYLPYDSEVVVKRMRGIGPNGAGEWWIEPPAAAYDRCVMSGAGGANYSNDSSVITANDANIPDGFNEPSSGIWSFPAMVGKTGNTDGAVFAVRNAAGLLGSPTAWDDTWVECRAFSWYRLTVHTTWSLAKLPESEAEAELAWPRHDHLYYDDPGSVLKRTFEDDLVSLHRRARVNTDHSIWVVTEAVPSLGQRHELGRSTLKHWYSPSDGQPMYATHSGVCQVNGAYRPGPLTWRLRVYSNGAYGVSVRPRLEYLTVTIEQCSDSLPDPAA
jgi:hypothetical protein